MRKLLSKLWADDDGFIISIELLFIAVILVIGLVAGWANLRAAIVSQYTTLANAILALNPGFEIDGISGDTGGSAVGGSHAVVSALFPFKLTADPTTASQSNIGLSATSNSGNFVDVFIYDLQP